MSQKKSYCVIGLGRFGYQVATKLNEGGKDVIVIDKNEEKIEKASKIFDIAFKADATDINSLVEIGIQNVRTIIVGVTSIEESIMVCANLREIGVKDIIAKANNDIHKRVLKTMGIARIVVPDIEIANRIAVQALYNIGIDIFSIGDGFSWVKGVVNNEAVVNKTLEKLDLRVKYDATVIMVQRSGKTIFPPAKDTSLMIGDVVTIMCRNEKIKSVVKLLNVEDIDND